MRVLKEYFALHEAQKLDQNLFYLANVNFYGLIVGLPVLYIYMFKSRAKYYYKLNMNKQNL